MQVTVDNDIGFDEAVKAVKDQGYIMISTVEKTSTDHKYNKVLIKKTFSDVFAQERNWQILSLDRFIEYEPNRTRSENTIKENKKFDGSLYRFARDGFSCHGLTK